jgi:hypothetical protein
MSKKNHCDVTRSKLSAAGTNGTPNLTSTSTQHMVFQRAWAGTDGRIILR